MENTFILKGQWGLLMKEYRRENLWFESMWGTIWDYRKIHLKGLWGLYKRSWKRLTAIHMPDHNPHLKVRLSAIIAITGYF